MALSGAAEAWSEQLAGSFAGLHAERLNGRLPAGTLTGLQLDDVQVFDVRGSGQIVRRTSRTARTDSVDLVKMCLVESGCALVEQGRRRVSIEPGGFALYDMNDPYQLTLVDRFRLVVMTVPRGALGVPDALLQDLMEQRHVADSGVGQVLASCLRSALDQREAMADAAVSRVREAAVALLSAALGAVADRSGAQSQAVLRERVLDHVRARLFQPDLSPPTVAAALHMSQRTLHRLFEDSDSTFSATVRRLRLEAVRRDLSDPLLAGRSIAAVAARWGITDQPWLSRAFRAQYGIPPSAARRPHD